MAKPLGFEGRTNMIMIEQDCVIEHEGCKFEAGGAVVTPDRITAYVGKDRRDGMGCDRAVGSGRDLTDWHGNVIGTIRLTKSWRIRSFLGSHMYQAYATVDGVTYTGRTLGEGMSFSGKRCKA
jgi:hypothetical protein